MTRADYIAAVKVKLEEISPFDEPQSFIAAGDSAENTVKPIISYIDKSLDEAAHDCLNSLPLSLLHADIERLTPTMKINAQGVGIIGGLSSTLRLVRFRHEALQRDITAFITSEDPLYLLQQNRYVRGGTVKPVAVWASSNDGANIGQLEIYSFLPELNSTTSDAATLLAIETHKTAEDVKSPIEEYITLRCAATVAQILNDANAAQALQQEYTNKLQATLQ